MNQSSPDDSTRQALLRGKTEHWAAAYDAALADIRAAFQHDLSARDQVLYDKFLQAEEELLTAWHRAMAETHAEKAQLHAAQISSSIAMYVAERVIWTSAITKWMERTSHRTKILVTETQG